MANVVSSPDIIYRDGEWLVVNKPCGMSTHGAFEGDLALQEWIALHWGVRTYVCSRLDKGTSGVLPLALTPRASAEAQAIHEQEEAEKLYLFLSHKERTGEWTVDTPLEGLSATTRFRCLGKRGDGFLYEARIARGRTHQIRKHAQASGTPILGDDDYGGRAAPRLYLHCARVCWPGMADPWEAPLPLSFDHPLRGSGFPEAFDRRLSFPASVSDAWRIVHRGEVEGLDFAADLYGRHLCFWIYGDERPELSRQRLERLAPLARETAARLGALGWVVKFPQRNPHSKKLVTQQEVFGEPPPPAFEVSEHGLRFGVTLTEQQHVGLFLDQRDSRRMVALRATGVRAANLFSYTCSFSAAALAGGAEVVFSVDASRKYLEMGCANLERNGLASGRKGKFVAEDVRSWLQRLERKVQRDGDGARLGLVVCDPPTFSSTREGRFSVEQEWESLAALVSSVLAPGGVAFFSTNHRAGERDVYLKILGRHFSSVARRSAPLDFPLLGSDFEHVKMFVCNKQ